MTVASSAPSPWAPRADPCSGDTGPWAFLLGAVSISEHTSSTRPGGSVPTAGCRQGESVAGAQAPPLRRACRSSCFPRSGHLSVSLGRGTCLEHPGPPGVSPGVGTPDQLVLGDTQTPTCPLGGAQVPVA